MTTNAYSNTGLSCGIATIKVTMHHEIALISTIALAWSRL